MNPLYKVVLTLAAAVLPQARIDNAMTFPYFAAGGGWESTIVLANVADAETQYRIRFYGVNGQPASVTWRDRTGRITSGNLIEARMADDGGDQFVLVDAGPLQTGWAQLEYDGDNRIAAMVVFRQRVSGRPDFEATVPLTRNDETRFWVPFDNTSALATSIALTNPSTSDSTDLQIRFWDYEGNEILTQAVRMGAGTTLAFSLSERFPQLANRAGTMRVEGSGGRLSAIALRFNPTGAFTTVPVSSR